MINKPKYILIHCSDAGEKVIPDQFKSINEWHKERDFSLSSLGYYIGYHRVVTGGKNYQARLDTDEGCHCNQEDGGMSLNFQSLAVCVGFDGDVEYPNQTHYNLLRAQILAWQEKYNIPDERVKMHREFTPWKTCPGGLITREWVETLIKKAPIVKPPAQVENQDKLINIQNQLTMLQRAIIALQELFNKYFKPNG